jgi:hypothetical protein
VVVLVVAVQAELALMELAVLVTLQVLHHHRGTVEQHILLLEQHTQVVEAEVLE